MTEAHVSFKLEEPIPDAGDEEKDDDGPEGKSADAQDSDTGSGLPSASASASASDLNRQREQDVGAEDSLQDEELREFFTRSGLYDSCCPHRSVPWKQQVPLVLAVLALATTAYASWDCSFVDGAIVSFTGSRYGIWTLLDSDDKCQLWPVLFFSYKLDPALKVARFFSMAAMLLGLALVAVLVQALQFHAVSWGIGLMLMLLLTISLFTTSIFNLWTVFFAFTYVILVLLVRFFFVHPVPRRISATGSKILAFHCLLNGVYCALTLSFLKSNFCTCKNLTAKNLEDREPGSLVCEYEFCVLGQAAFAMMVASVLWFATGGYIFKMGRIQGEQLKVHNTVTASMYGDFPRHSIMTRFNNLVSRLSRENNAVDQAEEQEQDVARSRTASLAPRNTNRTCCQKFCFDYRVKPRGRTEKLLFWSFRTGLGIMIFIYLLLCVILMGSHYENTQAAKAPDTSYNFITDVVCAFQTNADTGSEFKTFATKADATAEGYTVAHCGACSQCSNAQDIRTYVETRKTVARSAKKCGPTAIFRSYDKLADCLEDRIGFTEQCTECWADNMQTTAKHCLLTCMTTMFTGFATNNNVKGAGDEGWLNQCLFCDEKRSGPAFVQCSGVARRRLGIRSEIERNPEEQCPHVDLDWVATDFDTLFPQTVSKLDST